MTQLQGVPDISVISEFGEGELSERLWIGGLRIAEDQYKLLRGTRALSIALRDGLDFRINDGTVEKLVNAIETCWNDPERMRRACAPVLMTSNHMSALSPSLVKIILSIDLFQTPMISCIVNKISELGEDSCSDKDIAHALLNQLRWLDFIIDGPKLCENLLSIIPVISTSMQKELVEALPEILDDSSRNPAVTELMRLLEESPSMMGSIVDALGALGVDEERIADVNTSIMSTLGATNRDMLPVTLKYLLRSCPQNLVTETVNSLRSTLALPSLGPEIGKLCLDAVTSGLRMSKLVADQVLKTLRKLEKPSDHKPADLWILLALIDSPLHRKPAEILFRKKAAHNFFSHALIEAAFAPFSDSFHDIADRLINLASVSVRSQEDGARKTGVFLFSTLFRLFSNPNVRRNVLLCLLDHTGTRRFHETGAALQALSIIARESEKDRSLLPYSALIQGLLDYLEFFNPSQIRQIWTVLGFLCRAASGGSTSVFSGQNNGTTIHQSERAPEDSMGGSELASLEILLRKELTHTDIFYKKIGVIGACSMVKTLGTSVHNNILTMLVDVGRTNPFCQALAFDELAKVFAQKPTAEKDTAEVIRKMLSVQFEKRYLKDLSETRPLVKDELLLPAQLYGNLEGEETDMCFSISFLVRNESSLSARQDSVRSMVPNLRLLCVLTSLCFDGSLSEVDAIIGSPLHLPLPPKDQSLEDLHMQAKCDALLSLFVAHGWMIELVNAFAEQESVELKAKCVKRVDNLLDITSQINHLILQVPSWSEILFDSYCGAEASPAKLEDSVKKSSKKRATREPNSSVNQMPKSVSEWKKLSRQLHPSAFSLIRITAPVSYRFTETNTESPREGNPVFETVTLSSAALQFLLSDLFHYLERLIGSNMQYESPFGTLLFRLTNNGNSRALQSICLPQAATGSPLVDIKGLKVALTSLGKQLKRSLSRMFPEDGTENTDDSTNASLHVDKICAVLCLKCISICLSSRIMFELASQQMLFDILASIRLDDEPCIEPSDPLTDADVHAAAKAAFQQLQNGLSSVLTFGGNDEPEDHDLPRTAVLGFEGCCDFLGAMESAFSHCSPRAKDELGNEYSQIALAIIENQWNTAILRARKTQKLIPGIVKIHIQRSRQSLKVLETLRDEVLKFSENSPQFRTQVEGSQQKSLVQSSRICSLTEQTFFAFTISVLEQYILLFKKFQPDACDKTEDAFNVIIRFVKAELPLYSLARKSQPLLGPVMRAGRTLVDLFLKTFLPYLKSRFREHRSAVIQICKMHQKPTRLLQTLCAHSKFIRDTSLTNLVPSLRKSLELVLYRVKELLQANNAKNAFQLGNLKHRDINGEVLSSQHLQYNSESEESEYSSLAITDDDGDESGSNGDEPVDGEDRDKARIVSHKKARKTRRSESGSGNVPKRRKVSSSHDRRKETASELDLGSDVDTETRENQIGTSEITRAPTRKSSKRTDIRNKDDDEKIDHLTSTKRRKTKRISVIDDEADADEDDEEEDEEKGEEEDLSSQFLIFDDEEEEAEAN
ncbi:unnamed protein product [Agarophyton chilense]|eukprot:gb/GEZJ01000184.1/.p1 GENE.gb/GEZJ01000184.1/~~gb/GEZJ01000184.1/.p1  ORF type:complete len:1526 (+),score=241.85 gb/GEZJ01000184.1/:11003-15580(+)